MITSCLTGSRFERLLQGYEDNFASQRANGRYRKTDGQSCRLLMSITHSILLYECETWVNSGQIPKADGCSSEDESPPGCDFISHGFRTVHVLAGLITIQLLARERKRVYKKEDVAERRRAKEEATVLTIHQLQKRWEKKTRGRWLA